MSVDFDLDMELEDLTLEEPSEGTPELDFGEELELELEAVSEDDLEDLLEREENVLPEVEVSSLRLILMMSRNTIRLFSKQSRSLREAASEPRIINVRRLTGYCRCM